jgi:hypothetical protein
MANQDQSSEAPRRTSSYRVDLDGRLNNYPIEPEMYINQPGDLRKKEEEEKAQRHHELEELQEDETGKLTMEHDFRHKGPGLV